MQIPLVSPLMGTEKFLKELKQYGLENNIPNISEEVGKFLNFLVKISGAKTGLEIGCANGYSTIWLAEAFQKNGGNLISIDFSVPSLKQAKENLEKAELAELVDFRFGDALKIIPQLEQKFDFIFLDAQKGNYHLFWEIIKTKLHAKSIIVVDDVIKFPQKTQLFLEQMQKETEFDSQILPLDADDGIMVITKK